MKFNNKKFLAVEGADIHAMTGHYGRNFFKGEKLYTHFPDWNESYTILGFAFII